MEFNSIVFPRPFFSSNIISNYEEELLFIPKSLNNTKTFIPCIFMKDHSSHSKNIIIMFHGNAEDIFGARLMGETLVQKLRMNVLIIEYPVRSQYQSNFLIPSFKA